MARMHGEASKYLKWMNYGNVVAAICYLMILGWIWIVGFAFNLKLFFTLPGFIVSLVSFGPLAWIAYRQFKIHEKDADKFYRGRKGEGAIYYELFKLPNSYAVFQGIKNGFGDIDFTVIGPTGIFTVEVKSNWGFITENILHMSRIFGKDILSQSRGQAGYIHGFISQKTGKDFGRVNPIIVFSSFRAKLRFWLRPVDGVQVVQRALLNKAISDGTGRLSDAEILELESIFVKVLDEQKKEINS